MNEHEEFPNELYRGISIKDAVSDEGYILPAAFQFSAYDAESRNDDGYCELSVNWNDGDESLKILLNQRKKGSDEYQFKVGYCIIDRTAMDRDLRIYKNDSVFAYERRPMYDEVDKDMCINPYHGNLLLKTNNRQVKRIIETVLANLATTNGGLIRRGD